MKKTIMAARRQRAIEAISDELNIPFSDIRKGNSEHRQLFTLERIATGLKDRSQNAETAVLIDDILELDGLSQKSRKAIAARFTVQL